MDLATFSRRIRRADFLDGLGIYVETDRVSMAHVRKRLLRVSLRESSTYPLAPLHQPEERARRLTEAVVAFLSANRIVPGAVHLCLARHDLILNRLILPAAAAENLRQVLEYEIERVIPLPRDEVFFDYQVRPFGEGETARLAVLVVSVPRRLIQLYVDALDAAGVRPKAVGVAASALGDYTAFCRGTLAGPVAMITGSDGGPHELATFVGERLVASHVLRDAARPSAGELQTLVRRDLGEVFQSAEAEIEVLHAGATDASASDLIALASGRLDAPAEFFERPQPFLLPAIGAALGAVREGVVGINLLPEEQRPGIQEGLFVPILLLVAVVVLAFVYGGSVIVRDEITRRALARRVEELEPQVATVRKEEAEARKLREQIKTLTVDADRRMVQYLKELTDRIPIDAYLTTMRYRNGRIEIDGFANKASELIQILESSAQFRNVQFTSPTTAGQGGQERFSIVLEVEE